MPLIAAIFALSTLQNNPFDPGKAPLLMRHPTMNADSIVFQFADDLWSVPREGGDAHRLTSAIGTESNPFFSPDGTMVAFSGQYDGNTDVFIVPAKGGVPKRLTYHPAGDVCEGWTPDGKSVLFSSAMLSATDGPRLFTVSVAAVFYPSERVLLLKSHPEAINNPKNLLALIIRNYYSIITK